jgi:hypothetical protein
VSRVSREITLATMATSEAKSDFSPALVRYT